MSTEDKPQGESAAKNRPRKRMPWWRAYEGLPTSPRWRVAARRSKRPIPEVIAVVMCLFDTASSAEDRGDVSGFDAEVCAAGLDMETGDVESIVSAFESSGWIAEGRIATWDDRQTVVSEDPNGAERQRRHRDKKKREAEGVTPVTCDIRDVTQCHDRGEQSRLDREREQISLSNESRSPAGSQVAFDAFWAVWPNKVGKRDAQKVFSAALKRVNGDAGRIMAGAKRYIESKPADRQWLNPATFLNQDRFDDAPAPMPEADPMGISSHQGVFGLEENEMRRSEHDARYAKNPLYRWRPLKASGGGASTRGSYDL